MAGLVLGPLLRYVDESSATVWVETDAACEVEVAGAKASTFGVGGHHYALVIVEGLESGCSIEYQVRLDGEVVWPEPSSTYPPSRIRTRAVGGRELRLLFGSCRAAKHAPPGQPDKLGLDALDAYVTRMSTQPEQQWPEALLLLGDQVYADEPTPRTQEWLRRRHEGTDRPGTEVVDFTEYAHLYAETWADPDIRWLLSTVPSLMIFDDHDVRDDWNTSQAWRDTMAEQPWWRDRIQGALASYWVYQHLGNLAPVALASDEFYAKVLAAGRDGDALPLLLEFAQRADSEVDGHKPTRWSYLRDFGRVRLLVIDTRCGRILAGGSRRMVSDEEFEWIERHCEGDFDHLLIGSSLPWLLPHVIAYLQSINEVACRRGGWRGRFAEWLRQLGDLEHWSSFRASFDRLATLIRQVADGGDGSPPATVCMLSGDVHHSYLAEAHVPSLAPDAARILQVTCSPVHNEPPAYFRPAFRIGWSGWLGKWAERWARRAGVAPLPLSWSKLSGPHFGNEIALLTVHGYQADVVMEQAVQGTDGARLVEIVRARLS